MSALARARRPRGATTAVVVLVLVAAGVLGAAWATGGDDDPQGSARLAVQARSAAAPDAGPTFSVGTFNVLGSQHTVAGNARGFASGKDRAATTAELVRRKRIDLMAFQEVQRDQLRVLQAGLPDHDVWPARTLGRHAVRLQIAWDRRVFALHAAGSIDTPFDRQLRPMPWVELTHLATGRSIFVVNTHNSPRGQEEERDAATDQQLALIAQLRATRKAVLFVGDMNEKKEIFCKVVGKAGLSAANGGRATSRRDCTPPTGRVHIDWIFGGGPIAFTGYHWYAGKQVQRASDHHLIRAQVSVRPPTP